MSQPPAGGYPPPDQSQPGGYQPGPPAGGYPPPAGGYPPPAPNYTPPAGPPPGGYQPPPAPGYGPPPGAPGGYAPPAGGYPPPAQGYQPAPQGYGPPGSPAYPPPGGGGTPSFDASKVGTSDWIIIGSGLVLLIFSFFGWYSVSYSGGGFSISSSVGAWHEYWWLATVLGVAVAVIVGLRATMGQAISQVKPLYLMLAAAGGFVITLIALIENFASGDSGAGYSYGPGVGAYVCLVVSAAQTYFVWLWAQKQPGWTLPKLPGPTF